MAKIEIDLDDILGDEYGSETLQDSIKRQVVDKLSEEIKNGVGKKIDSQISTVINDEIRKAVEIQMPTLIDDLINKEYTPVNQWGSQGKTTTFREALLESITNNMVYKNTTYSSDQNAFTRSVNSVIEEKVKEFKKEFDMTVDKKYVEEVTTYAIQTLKKKLNI